MDAHTNIVACRRMRHGTGCSGMEWHVIDAGESRSGEKKLTF